MRFVIVLINEHDDDDNDDDDDDDDDEHRVAVVQANEDERLEQSRSLCIDRNIGRICRICMIIR